MTFLEVCALGVTRVHVSMRTYTQLIRELDRSILDINTGSIVDEGGLAIYAGLTICLSKALPDGQMSLFQGDHLYDIVTWERKVAHAEPHQSIPGVWCAYAADGEFLWHITNEGARKIPAAKGLPL